MTIGEAICTEVKRYVEACEGHQKHLAHIRFLVIQRLKHHVLGRV